MGTKQKFWCTSPEGESWLFKYARLRDGIALGEDWAEWITCNLGRLLGLPTSLIVPATLDHEGEARRGILSKNFVTVETERLVHGNELLSSAVPSYSRNVSRRNPDYTVEAIEEVLRNVGVHPAHTITGIKSAFGLFVGYLVLDAWTAGRDRHHENWGIIRSSEGAVLAPTFDHGNALGFAEVASRISSLVSDPTAIERWARHGTSPHFAGAPTLVELAQQGLKILDQWERDAVVDRISSVDTNEVHNMINSVPHEIMSADHKRFALSLLELNRKRILHDS